MQSAPKQYCCRLGKKKKKKQSLADNYFVFCVSLVYFKFCRYNDFVISLCSKSKVCDHSNIHLKFGDNCQKRAKCSKADAHKTKLSLLVTVQPLTRNLCYHYGIHAFFSQGCLCVLDKES